MKTKKIEIKFSQEISDSHDELHKSETRLVVKFYLNLLYFHLFSVGLNIDKRALCCFTVVYFSLLFST